MPKEKAQAVKLGLIGAGGCGGNNVRDTLDALSNKEHPHLFMLVANTDGPHLDKHFTPGNDDTSLRNWLDDEQLTVLKIGSGIHGAGGKPEVGEKAIGEQIEAIRNFLEPLDAVICIGGGGGGTGSGVLPVIAQLAKEMGKSILCILTMPLLFEGTKRLRKAMDAKERLLGICPTIVIYNQQHEAKEQSFLEAWKAINGACLLPTLLFLRELIQEVGEGINVDLADWTSVLQAGNHVEFGYSELAAETSEVVSIDMDKIARELLENAYQDKRIIAGARELLLWLHGKWSLDQAQVLVGRITDRIKLAQQGQMIEVNTGILENVTDGKRWVALIAVAETTPDESESAKVVAPVAPIAPPAVIESKLQILDPVFRTASISCYVDGQSCSLQVTPETAGRFNRHFSRNQSPVAAQAEFEEIAATIRQETGAVISKAPNGSERR